MIVKQVDWIYVERLVGNRNAVITKKEEIAGIHLLRVQQMLRNKTRHFRSEHADKESRANRKLWRVLKKYAGPETILMADETLAREGKLPNVLFEARKQELLENKHIILKYFRMKKRNLLDRSTFLLVLDSTLWKQQEITVILSEVKNYYEDIQILAMNTVIDMEQLKEFFLEEYGLVLHMVTEKMVLREQVEAAFFLTESWKEQMREYPFRLGYLVAEWENGLMRRKKRLHGVQEGRFEPEQMLRNEQTLITEMNAGELYAGLVYEREKREIPYEIAVTLADHNLQCNRNGDEGMSIVAIYAVK